MFIIYNTFKFSESHQQFHIEYNDVVGIYKTYLEAEYTVSRLNKYEKHNKSVLTTDSYKIIPYQINSILDKNLNSEPNNNETLYIVSGKYTIEYQTVFEIDQIYCISDTFEIAENIAEEGSDNHKIIYYDLGDSIPRAPFLDVFFDADLTSGSCGVSGTRFDEYELFWNNYNELYPISSNCGHDNDDDDEFVKIDSNEFTYDTGTETCCSSSSDDETDSDTTVGSRDEIESDNETTIDSSSSSDDSDNNSNSDDTDNSESYSDSNSSSSDDTDDSDCEYCYDNDEYRRFGDLSWKGVVLFGITMSITYMGAIFIFANLAKF